ncbi:unnamed protein product [Cuscuta europaea]|uniref:Transcription elongation factor Eaf N-terminal domain-containing protein n=1 Tax=Cuscuta europaea TaxID=41803 RepID=A0A9P0Z5P4_CUSEU|nr:unnamed protein product [Cuscuta europaea]
MNINNKDEPNTAPKHDQWYNLKLGSTFKEEHPSSKFCTLRYEFKPASIDKSQPGKLHKTKDNRVTVEFQNSQPGKPKVNFEGSSEDYKENDAVLLFDGVTFRLERLHRAVKRLKHVRLHGESVSASGSASLTIVAESSSPPIVKAPIFQSQNSVVRALPIEVERIEIGDIKSSDMKLKSEKAGDNPSSQGNQPNLSHDYPSPLANQPNMSPQTKSDDLDEQLDIMNDDDMEGDMAANGGGVEEIDINKPHQNNVDNEEFADVDGSDEEDNGRTAAQEDLRVQQANGAGGGEHRTSSSSSSSGSDSSGSSSSSSSSSSRSGSDSGSSSSDADSSDGEAVISI